MNSKKNIEPDEEELVILSNIVETASQLEISSVMKSILQFRVMLYMPVLAEEVIIRNSHIKEVSPRTLLLWYNEFDKSGYRGFEEDRRGIGKSDSFITDFNLTNQFKLYMKTTNNLGIELTRKYLQKIIIELDLVKDLEEYSLQFPLVQSTVYRWMRQNGANYCKAKKCYYTDRHDTVENIYYRNNVYIPLMDLFTRRMPEFVSVPLDNANSKALQDIRNIRGLVDNDPIPTFLDEETDIEMVKIHCDWLKDECYEKFRKKCLYETGFPGQFLYQNQH